MVRGTRKTIEYTDEDLFLRFLLQDSEGTKHWAVYKVQDVNNHKAKPVGVLKSTPHTISIAWSNPMFEEL